LVEVETVGRDVVSSVSTPGQPGTDRSGVNRVGTTAHYVTPDLDEGPIIEQEVIRIDHTFDPRHLTTAGRDAEALALSRAVHWHCERRVLLNDRSTVVFR
jgi:formyltetrahydrofolate deformylase